ncbi:MAG: endolytic transglycosylase MltG [Anaerolineaceae bacterium]|nr:endolytic transglycosylase MltG [Anaerolineaceae bacterium]
MKTKRNTLLVSAVTFLVLLAVIFLILKDRIRQTEQALGPASDGLGTVQRIRLSLLMADKTKYYGEAVNSAKGQFLLDISQGESVGSVIAKIADGLETDADLLRMYWIYTGADHLINPGRFVLSGKMTIPEITDLVTAAEKSLVRFAFFSGMRLEEIAELIDMYDFTFTGEEFLQAAAHYPAERHPAGETSLEGYFVPGTYEMSRNIPLDTFLSNFVNVFHKKVRIPYEEAFAANGLSLHQAVIMSSMIAREAMSGSEYGLIASVFYNRLSAGMKLESDPTAQYAIGWDAGSNSWWKMPLTAADVSIYSPYNTYIADGFPPGPICSPSAAIYEAVAHPEQTDYYYFRARCDNTPYHNFSRTYQEHVANGCN